MKDWYNYKHLFIGTMNTLRFHVRLFFRIAALPVIIYLYGVIKIVTMQSNLRMCANGMHIYFT